MRTRDPRRSQSIGLYCPQDRDGTDVQTHRNATKAPLTGNRSTKPPPVLSPGQGLRTRAKRTTGKQGLRYTPRPEAPHYYPALTRTVVVEMCSEQTKTTKETPQCDTEVHLTGVISLFAPRRRFFPQQRCARTRLRPPPRGSKSLGRGARRAGAVHARARAHLLDAQREC